jgi:DNA-binding transcriptional LysR family regulator
MNEFDRVGALALRHLVAFETVAEERSFTRAAQRLGYTQSAVSHQMATLERLVGKQLIERPRGTEAATLTEAGEILHRHAQALIRRVKLAYDDLDGLAEGVSGTFRFGTYQSASTSILPHVLRQFAQLFPLVRVHLTESVDDLSLIRELEQGTLDASFVSLPLPEGPLTAIELLRDPYVLLVAPDSPFAVRKRAPSLAEIAQLSLIAWKSWRGVEDMVRERGYELNVIMRSDDSDTVRSLVGAGVGVAIVPRLIVDPGGSLVPLALDDLFGERVLAIAWHPERRRTPVLDAFTELVQEVCASDLPAVSRRPGSRRG